MAKKLINHPDRVIDDMLSGILRMHGGLLKKSDEDPRAIVRTTLDPGTVGVVIGGDPGTSLHSSAMSARALRMGSLSEISSPHLHRTRF
ncbi:hypothetical protein [Alicyclobacillus fastidiosus]|uniref:hypothetical protein n=1 Tax=Alicyclobacillus fastidiosus TaxID=392011 RepID=UPI0032B01B41